MGGLVILLSNAASCLVASNDSDSSLLFAVVVTIIFGVIGFLDDYIKIVQKRSIANDTGVSKANLGLHSRHKFLMQFAIATSLAIFAAYHPNIGTAIIIPFTDVVFDLGPFYIPFAVVTIVAVLNAVNFTDGLDGLASGVTMIVFIFFFVAAMSNGMTSMGVFAASVIGACLGFLVYNFNPAKLFMGDTGSMALGGAVSAIAVLTRTELFILIAGFVYAVELISVALQVSYYRLSHGKRIFRMAPIHHHFELKGWNEQRIVIVFWVVTAVCVMISMLSLNILYK
jgi:phospho-N-acetylmuramoyl-pentapeptide-transferase